MTTKSYPGDKVASGIPFSSNLADSDILLYLVTYRLQPRL